MCPPGREKSTCKGPGALPELESEEWLEAQCVRSPSSWLGGERQEAALQGPVAQIREGSVGHVWPSGSGHAARSQQRLAVRRAGFPTSSAQCGTWAGLERNWNRPLQEASASVGMGGSLGMAPRDISELSVQDTAALGGTEAPNWKVAWILKLVTRSAELRGVS